MKAREHHQLALRTAGLGLRSEDIGELGTALHRASGHCEYKKKKTTLGLKGLSKENDSVPGVISVYTTGPVFPDFQASRNNMHSHLT